MEQDVDTGCRPMCSACLSSDRDLFELNSSTQVYQIFRLLMYDFAGDRVSFKVFKTYFCILLLKQCYVNIKVIQKSVFITLLFGV